MQNHRATHHTVPGLTVPDLTVPDLTMFGHALLGLTLFALAAPLLAAGVYQWKDAQGRTVYSDQPPPPSVKPVQPRVFRPSVIEGGESYALRTAREKFPVTLYTAACGAMCDNARKLLADRGIPHTSKDAQSDPDTRAELTKLTGKNSVPVLVIGSEKIEGYAQALWDAALDRAGYPKKPALPSTPAAPKPATPPTTP